MSANISTNLHCPVGTTTTSTTTTTTTTESPYFMSIGGDAQGPPGGQGGANNVFKAVVYLNSLPIPGVTSQSNIVVDGYLRDDDTDNQYPFQVTILAGDLTAETGYILSTGPASGATCFITAISTTSVVGSDSNTYTVYF